MNENLDIVDGFHSLNNNLKFIFLLLILTLVAPVSAVQVSKSFDPANQTLTIFENDAPVMTVQEVSNC